MRAVMATYWLNTSNPSQHSPTVKIRGTPTTKQNKNLSRNLGSVKAMTMRHVSEQVIAYLSVLRISSQLLSRGSKVGNEIRNTDK